ncbi:MAG: class I SAM-dependent methyltransferase [Blastocatellia bacterium]
MSESNEAKELACLYDLVIVPQWREPFDQMVDEEIQLPKEGKFLEAGCGTGGYAVDLALRGGYKVSVLGIDSNAERLAIARGKAEIKKLDRAAFQQGTLIGLGVPDEEFDLVIGDGSMLPVPDLEEAFAELARVAKPNAQIALKLTTRGSFDEFHSIYWEALYNLDLIAYSPPLESLIMERLTASEAESLANAAGLKQIRSVTRKERFDFADAGTFFESPLIETFFLDDWLAILPDGQTRERVRREMARIMEEERNGIDFDVSIKATVVIGRK